MRYTQACRFKLGEISFDVLPGALLVPVPEELREAESRAGKE